MMNENRLENLETAFSKETVKQVVLAKKMYEELKNKSLSEVLKKQLPATEEKALEKAAEDMLKGIEDMYSGLDEKVDSDQVEKTLNEVLKGLNPDKQGKILVNLLNCMKAVECCKLDDNMTLERLSKEETLDDYDVEELMSLVKSSVSRSAGFMIRQEFEPLKNRLGKVSPEVIESQMNSGREYAKAYAAAMYITVKGMEEYQEMTPYELGLLAAKNVESSKLLANYHYGKIKWDEMKEKIKSMSEKMLTLACKTFLSVAAFGIKGYMGYLLGEIAFKLLVSLSVTSAPVLALGTIAGVIIGFTTFRQEEIEELLTNAWENIKEYFSCKTEPVEETYFNKEETVAYGRISVPLVTN